MSLRGDHIAVVGMAARFPGADSADEFWWNLCDGVESVEWRTPEELREMGVDEAEYTSDTYVSASYSASDLDGFDPGFFGLTQREAEIKDPQHRLFLELANTALEHAGYDHRRMTRRVGVFGGTANSTYREDYVFQNAAVMRATGGMSVSVGNYPDYVAPLVSYKFGFLGPSISVYTACSTSLVAVHLAAQSLRIGECDVALAGGAQVDLPLGAGYAHVEGSIYSADGHVRPFDANASGTIFSNGGGVVVLKLLEDALKDGDTIHAVIRGSAVNNDGDDRAGFTAPGVHGQTELILDALSDAEIDPSTIGYLEAHGTGTVVGDPIEISAISEAYAQHTSERGFCALASLKGNVGHLGPVAGIASLIKAAYALREGVIPVSINCTELNPALELDKTPFRLQRETTRWESAGTPLRAAISSFGIGGTNAHAILERAPEPEPAASPADDEQGYHVLPLSARSADALEQAAADLAAHLQTHGSELADVAGTLQNGRGQHNHRRAVVAATPEEAVAALRRDGDPALSVDGRGSKLQEVAFLFPGQGAQYPGMALGLYRTQPVYREALDRCAAVLAKVLDRDLLDLLHADASDSEAAALLAETRITQPVTFAVDWALAQLWRSWGISPAAMLGHSVGEYVAATLAGVLDLEDALRLVAGRGALMQSLPRGAMLALPLDAEAVRPLLDDPELDGEVQLAASNSPSASVVSGTQEGVDKLRGILEEMGLQATPLRTSHAFHSRMMDPVLEQFRELVASVRLSAPSLPYVSNVTGDWITEQEATDPDYWVRHLRGEVRFAAGLGTLARRGGLVLLEVGAGQALSSFARQHAMVDGGQIAAAQTLRSPNKTVDDEAFVLAAAARLWASGVHLDWAKVTGRPHRRVPLPTYPYERRRCWVSPDPVTDSARTGPAQEEGTKPPLQAPLYVPVWTEAPHQRHQADNALGETWLVVTDDDTRGHELIESCRATGAFVVPAVSGFGFSDDGDGYVVDPDDPTSVRELLEAAWDAGQAPDRVLYTAGVFTTADDVSPALAQRTYDRLLYLAQGLARVAPEKLDLLVVTDRAHAVTGAEGTVPYTATARGPLMAITTEVPGVRTRHLDVQTTDEPVRLLRSIVRELSQDAEDHVAVRGARRWVRDYRPIANEPSESSLLRDEGVYLITGGLGGLGLEIAKDLAARHRARLVLVGRSALPPAEKWDAVLADPATGAEIRRRICGIRELESLGAQVLVGTADVTDETAMAEVVRAARERFGPVNGVIHAAGLPGGALMEIHTPEAAAPVLSPKTGGTILLDRLCGEEVDFIALFSSIISVCGDYAHSDYAAANAFMDAFAASRDVSGPYVVSINWAGWSEVGMVADGNLSQGIQDLARAQSTSLGHPLMHRRYDDESALREYESELRPEAHWVLTDHRLDGVGVMPGTSLLEMVREAVRDTTAAEHITLSEVIFIDPLAVADTTTIRVRLSPDGDDGWIFELTAHDTSGTGPRVHCRGRARIHTGSAPAPIDLEALRTSLHADDLSDFDESDEGVMTFGPRWDVVTSYRRGEDGRGLAELTLPHEFHADAEGLVIHPSLMDRATSFGADGYEGHNYLPFTYRSVTIFRPVPTHCWAVQQHRSDPQRPDFLDVDVTITDDTGQPCVVIEGYTMRSVRIDSTQPADAQEPDLSEPSQAPSDRLRTVEGQEIFRRILALRPSSQVVVCPEGLFSRLARVRSFGTAELGKAGNAFADGHAARTLDTPYIAPETEVQQVLSRLWGEALGVAEVGIDDDFFAIGGSSLVAVQLIARIADQLSVRLSVADLFEYATVRALAGFIETRLIEALGQLSDEEAQAMLADGETV
ncbi:type I polyketide synthase [Streptomyces marianii]|uniref:SDR family NAD(P)-dependent oxidoreductase n=1 Tax=Streptomyces marianii TaxID=1817406 RepID=A0A5R9E6L9_9ACTN|nr:type I polyketide synthase [Streptomyces marianii]TLQ44539.1 SDR family NAD(P)-dependent oxidoreductase [Streptomyces marianii]